MNRPEHDCQWLAYELHDGLLPWLHGAHMQLAGLNVNPESERQYQLAMHCLKAAMEEGRDLIGFLEGLESNQSVPLEDRIGQMIEKSQPVAHAQAQQLTLEGSLGDTGEISVSTCWDILRIVQQAVQNAIQHAGPTQVRVLLKRSDRDATIQISDQGRGFDPSAPIGDGHFGLASMRQRARKLGGRIDISSQPGRGTQISLTIPLESKQQPASDEM